MSSRATFVTSDNAVDLSDAFLEKWKDKIHTNDGNLPISSKVHGSICGFWHLCDYTESGLMPDIQAELKRLDSALTVDVIFWEADQEMATRFQITKDSISEAQTMF